MILERGEPGAVSDERPFGPWDCDRLRASAFRAPNEEFAAGSHTQWWNEAVGRQFLQSMEDRPSDGVVTYTGIPRHGGQLVMDVRADRVDWFLQPGGATDVPPGALVTIRDELLSDFRGTVERWLALIEPALLTRLAFGANLVSQVATEADAHDELARIIGFGRELYSPDVSDFLFRINRSRKMHDGVMYEPARRVVRDHVQAPRTHLGLWRP